MILGLFLWALLTISSSLFYLQQGLVEYIMFEFFFPPYLYVCLRIKNKLRTVSAENQLEKSVFSISVSVKVIKALKKTNLRCTFTDSSRISAALL